MSTRVRLLAVLDDLAVGGTLEVVLSQLQALDPDRYEIGLLTLSDDLGRLAERSLPDRIQRLSTAFSPEVGYGVLDYLADGFLLSSAKKAGRSAVRTMLAFEPDVLHFHTHPRNLGLGILARRTKPCTLIFTDHGVRIRASDYNARVRALLRLAYRRLYRPYHVICVGPSVEATNRDSGVLHPDRVHLLLENQIDIDRFHPAPPAAGAEPEAESDVATIINVARLQPVKALDVLIEAFGRLDDVGPARLALVGPDEMEGSLHRLAEERVRPPLEVDFTGARSDIPELLRSATIGAMPSRREGLPLALLEMMACGLPVVVSDIPELALVVTHEHDGLIVPVEDAEALSVALRRLLGDPTLRRRLGKEARRTAERRMSVDAVGVLEAFYEEAMARG